jgi:hypothetical protein
LGACVARGKNVCPAGNKVKPPRGKQWGILAKESKLFLKLYSINKIVSHNNSLLINMDFFPQSGMTPFVRPVSAE